MSANTGLLLVFSFGLSFVFGDYNYGYETDFVYPQPDRYTNTSRQYYHSGTGRTRRIFDDEIAYSLITSINFRASIPLPALNTALFVSMPINFFNFHRPTPPPSVTTTTASSGIVIDGPTRSPLSGKGRSFPVASLDSVKEESQRSAIYSGLERGVGYLTGADGHSCLLRAMCEASSTPLHDEGIIGDAITFLLTTNYVADESDQKFKKYFAAQAKGKIPDIDLDRQYMDNTALFEAFSNDLNEVFQILLEGGADPNIENEAGLTVLDFAYFYKNQKIIDILENFGGSHGSNYSEEYMEEYLTGGGRE